MLVWKKKQVNLLQHFIQGLIRVSSSRPLFLAIHTTDSDDEPENVSLKIVIKNKVRTGNRTKTKIHVVVPFIYLPFICT